MKKIKTAILISAFPGTGKTYYYNNTNLNVMDSDSSNFSKSGFPDNYMKHIKENINKADIIFISSHQVVRNALVREGFDFILVYPDISLMNEYLLRYQHRGGDDIFIQLLKENWKIWCNEMLEQKNCRHYVLKSGEYITDMLKIWKFTNE